MYVALQKLLRWGICGLYRSMIRGVQNRRTSVSVSVSVLLIWLSVRIMDNFTGTKVVSTKRMDAGGHVRKCPLMSNSRTRRPTTVPPSTHHRIAVVPPNLVATHHDHHLTTLALLLLPRLAATSLFPPPARPYPISSSLLVVHRR